MFNFNAVFSRLGCIMINKIHFNVFTVQTIAEYVLSHLFIC